MSEPSDNSATERAHSATVVIKKYSNRRLYSTASSGYVTLERLSTMVKEGRDFVVHDARTGEDITKFILAQIITDEEQKHQGPSLLPLGLLKAMIKLYSDSAQWLRPDYLDQTMTLFRQQMREYFHIVDPVRGLETLSQQQRALLELMNSSRRMLLMPFSGGIGGSSGDDVRPQDSSTPRAYSPQDSVREGTPAQKDDSTDSSHGESEAVRLSRDEQLAEQRLLIEALGQKLEQLQKQLTLLQQSEPPAEAEARGVVVGRPADERRDAEDTSK